MELLPAIDLRGGGAVRLVQGDFDRETGYGDPLALAKRFVSGGARWLHVVDLDAARTGAPVHRSLVLDIAVAAGVPVQTGGGIRSDDDVDELLSGGVQRVVLGTAALDDPEFAPRAAARHPGRVAVGLDYRRRDDGMLETAVRGWAAGSGRSVGAVLEELRDVPVGAFVVTAIDRDGTLAGPDTDGLAEVLAATEHPVVASGGVGDASHLTVLAALRGGSPARPLAGVVVGRALADGRLSVEEALAACATSG